MRVSLVTTADAYPATDSLTHLTRFLLRRGDNVQIYTSGSGSDLPQPPVGSITISVASSAELLAKPGFRSSELFIYHCCAFDPILVTLLALERGAVLLWLQPQDTFANGQSVPDEIVRLASASDIVVVDYERIERWVLDTGATDPGRLHVIPPVVSLAAYSPAPADVDLQRDLDLLGKRVLLHILSADRPHVPEVALSLLDGVRTEIPNAVLAIAPTGDEVSDDLQYAPERDDVRVLPPAEDLRSYYRLADLFLSRTSSAAGVQRLLEAMACGAAVLSDHRDGTYNIDRTLELLSDDTAYGESVRLSLEVAAQHSLEAFARAWGNVIASACGWLPVRLAPELPPDQSVSKPVVRTGSDGTEGAPVVDMVGIDTEQLKSMASVTLPDYEVRSPTPVFGPLIAWIRRNLTSHLRKPYLDPTLDRQEAFNLRAANALEELALQLAANQQTTAQQQTGHPVTVDPQVKQLIEQVESIVDTLAVDETTRAQTDIIRTALTQIRELLDESTAKNPSDMKD